MTNMMVMSDHWPALLFAPLPPQPRWWLWRRWWWSWSLWWWRPLTCSSLCNLDPKVQRWWWWWIWQRFSTFCNFFKRITHLHFSLQPSPHRPGAHGKHSPVTWWQVVPLNMNKSWCTLFSKYLERLLMLLWNFSLCFNSNGCSSLRHELILVCDFRCNMSRGWCFSGTSLQLQFYTSVGANSIYHNQQNNFFAF